MLQLVTMMVFAIGIYSLVVRGLGSVAAAGNHDIYLPAQAQSEAPSSSPLPLNAPQQGTRRAA